MNKFRVIYTLMLGGQEIDLSAIVEHDGNTFDDMDEIINKANTFINSNLHIPTEVLNQADIEVHPAP